MLLDEVETQRKAYNRLASYWLGIVGKGVVKDGSYFYTPSPYRSKAGYYTGADALQEALIDALKAEHRFDLSRKIRPWFMQILRNRCIMIMRYTNRHPSVFTEATRELLEVYMDRDHTEAEKEDLKEISFKSNGKIVYLPLDAIFEGFSENEKKAFIAGISGSNLSAVSEVSGVDHLKRMVIRGRAKIVEMAREAS
jgi:DNA-directed RNA polymerase specialized sigma24 family protein